MADDQVTIGGFAGAHLFSHNIELGTFDQQGADSPMNSVAFGVRAGYQLLPHLRLEAELATAPSKTRAGRDDITVISWRAHALVDLLPRERLHPFAVAGLGFVTGAPVATELLDEDTDEALHLGLGVEYDMAPTWALRADIRAVFVPSTQDKFLTTDYELFVGATKHFPTTAPVLVPDKDGDGVHDSDDQCPEAVEDQDGFRDEDGCPDLDNDEDGVLDADDQCPAEAESKNGIDDQDGCPEPDGDGDGILGSQDHCPTEAEDMDGYQDTDGCPDPDPVAPEIVPAVPVAPETTP